MSDLLYKVIFSICKFLFHIFYPYKIVGMENIPQDGALICGNHTHYADPLYVIFSMNCKKEYAAMGKEELFKNKFCAAFFRFAGVFPVSRGKNDLSAIRTSLKVLKQGKKLILFPEGTRVKPGMTVKPKTGAVRIANKTGAPIVPVYIPRDKGMFRRITVVVGKPYHPVLEDPNSYDCLTQATQELMDRIHALDGESR